MRREGTRFFLTVCGTFVFVSAIGILFDLSKSVAQSPNTQTPPCCQDRWNPNWMQRDMWGPGRMGPGMRHRMARHWTFMHQGIPETYRGARNPYTPDAKTTDQGRALYQENCASCHGAKGMGDGEVAKSLSPSPALLAYMIQMPMAVDGYLLWSVSEGGEAFGTAMPAFKDVLTNDEIWKIAAYMRAGFTEGQSQQ